jgi:hypothetical protein
MEHLEGKTCAVCGIPATLAARDTYEIEPNLRWRQFKVGLEIKYGCDAHPPISFTYRNDGSIEVTGNWRDRVSVAQPVS